MIRSLLIYFKNFVFSGSNPSFCFSRCSKFIRKKILVECCFSLVEEIKLSIMASSDNLKVYPSADHGVPLKSDWKKRSLTVSPPLLQLLERIHNFEVREDDVWLITMAKCGTTWAQEMAWLIMNDYDFEKAKEVSGSKRVPFLEFSGINTQYPGDSIKEAAESSSPRLIKSHLPLPFLPKQLWSKKPKIIYVSRNPKDALISLYHFMKAKGDIPVDLDIGKFVDDFIDGNIAYLPFWEHVLEFWQVRNEPNVLFTSYERMKQNLSSVIGNVCEFLGKSINDEQLENLLNHLSFDNMKNNPSCNRQEMIAKLIKKTGHDTGFKFMRRGIVGSFLDELSQSDLKKLDDWSNKYLNEYNLSTAEIFGVDI